MKTLIFQLPETVDITDKEAATAFAAQLYKIGKLSLGQASELAGYSKRTFMELLGNYGVSVLNQSVNELDSDIENAKNYNI